MIVWDEVPKKSRYNKTEILIYKCEAEILKFIPEKRDELGLTQQELSEKCGVKQPMIARLESPKHSAFLLNLLRVLVPLGYVLRIEKIDSENTLKSPKNCL